MGEEVVITGQDVEEINTTADHALNAMNEKVAALEAIIANTGLEGTAGEQLKNQLEEAKKKAQEATEKINSLKVSAVGKGDSYAETDAKVAQIANR